MAGSLSPLSGSTLPACREPGEVRLALGVSERFGPKIYVDQNLRTTWLVCGGYILGRGFLRTASSSFLIFLPFQMLFKKNLFEMAINLAKSQHLDSDGLAQIFMQYGDHLYSKGNHDGAVQQYIRSVWGCFRV